MFAPLSPTSSRRLANIHKDAEDDSDTMHSHPSGGSRSHHTRYESKDRDSTDANASYECQDRNSGDKRPRRHRERRLSDPSSDRPSQPSKHRRRSRRYDSRSPSPASDNEVEILPDRFDDEGRPLDRYGNRFAKGGLNLGGVGGKGQTEMVERIVRDVGDVVEGKKTWKDLLMGVLDETAGGASSASEVDSDNGRRRKRRG